MNTETLIQYVATQTGIKLTKSRISQYKKQGWLTHVSKHGRECLYDNASANILCQHLTAISIEEAIRWLKENGVAIGYETFSAMVYAGHIPVMPRRERIAKGDLIAVKKIIKEKKLYGLTVGYDDSDKLVLDLRHNGITFEEMSEVADRSVEHIKMRGKSNNGFTYVVYRRLHMYLKRVVNSL